MNGLRSQKTATSSSTRRMANHAMRGGCLFKWATRECQREADRRNGVPPTLTPTPPSYHHTHANPDADTYSYAHAHSYAYA